MTICEFDMEECFEEIRTCPGLILSEYSEVRSVVYNNKQFRRKLFEAISSKCYILEQYLEKVDPDEVCLSDIEEKFDLPLILNYYKALLNVPILAAPLRDDVEEHTIPPGGSLNSSRAFRDTISFYLVPQELDLDDVITRLDKTYRVSNGQKIENGFLNSYTRLQTAL